MTSLRTYGSEHRTVFIVRLTVHLAGCLMIFTGKADHSFLIANRRLLVLSLFSIASCMIMEEANVFWPSETLHISKLIAFKFAEGCIATIVLLGCVLLRSLTFRETYRLNNIFFLALGLQFAAFASDNTIKLGYLANSVVAAVAYRVLREFSTVFENDGPDSQNVRALMQLQGLLTVLNLGTFCASLYHDVYGLKLAQYVLQILAVTLFYLFVRPYVAPALVQGPKDIELLAGGKA